MVCYIHPDKLYIIVIKVIFCLLTVFKNVYNLTIIFITIPYYVIFYCNICIDIFVNILSRL